MRITLGMISRQYSKNLNNSLSALNTASNRATTFRKFDKTSEDPFSAAKAYRMRRESQQNEDYQSTLSDIDNRLLTAQSAMISLNNAVQQASSGDCLQAITGTMGADERAVIAEKLRTMQASVLSVVNTKFSDKYLFGGAETQTPPFTVGTTGLLYKGVNVETGYVEAGSAAAFNHAQINFNDHDHNGYTIKIANGAAGSPDDVSVTGTTITVTMDLAAGKTNGDLLNALNTQGFPNVTMDGDTYLKLTDGMESDAATDNIGPDGLKALAEEKSYVDLGMGLTFDEVGNIRTQSVFNSAIPGLSFLGYGTAGGDVSNNLYTLFGQIADQLESSSFSMDSIQPYLDSFEKQGQVLLSEITKSGTNSNFLTSLKGRLESTSDALVEQLDGVEFMEPATAILDYKMQQYVYQAALQMGTKILQPTFLDFMD